jgi:hypothetical protein
MMSANGNASDLQVARLALHRSIVPPRDVFTELDFSMRSTESGSPYFLDCF